MTPLNGVRAAGGFGTLGLIDRLVDAVSALGYEEPTPVQRETIPLLLAARDVLGQAATGTGKTAAFALPMLQRLAEDGAPAQADRRSGAGADARAGDAGRRSDSQVRQGARHHASLPVYGGAPISQQIRTLERGAGIVVATPGRALDHIRRGTLKLGELRMLVLDEADEMLDMGFAEDLDAILEATPKTRQTALFSATMPARILAIAQRHLTNPARVDDRAREDRRRQDAARPADRLHRAARAQAGGARPRAGHGEPDLGDRVLPHAPRGRDARRDAERARPSRAGAPRRHGAAAARPRDAACSARGKADLLVATDVAARGLDIEHLSHVVNYDVPRGGRRRTCTGSAAPAAPAATAPPSRSPSRASTGCCATIESFTKQKIEVATVPTVAELRARRLDVTRASIRERILAGDLDDVRVVVESLAQEFDIVDIAAAAVKLAHAAEAGDEAEREIPVVARRPAPTRSRRARDAGAEAILEGRGRRPGRPARTTARARGADEDVARLFIGAGREAGIRPGDLVGAITGEAGINSRELGAIRSPIASRWWKCPRPGRTRSSRR